MFVQQFKNRIILFLCAFVVVSSYAQDSDEELSSAKEYWLDYNYKNFVGNDNSIDTQFGYRSISPHIFNKIVVVPTYNILNKKSPKFLNRKKKPLLNSYHLGAGLYYTQNLDSENNLELRLMQGTRFFIPFIQNNFINNYIRLEERFQKTMDGSKWTSGLRVRYRISTALEWDKHRLSFTEGLYFPLSVELFFSLKESDRFNDKIRISPGIGYKLNDKWKIEFSVAYHNAQNTDLTDDTTNDIVFRLRVFNSSNEKRKTSKDKEDQLKELME